MAAIDNCAWPGNVRQLVNAIERAKILADDALVRLEDLPLEIRRPAPATVGSAAAGDDRLEEIERSHVLEVLERERGNKARAARALGINRRSLYRLLEKFGVAS